MLKDAEKPYSAEAATVSVMLDIDMGGAKSIRTYSRTWGWHRNTVNRRLPGLKEQAESWRTFGKSDGTAVYRTWDGSVSKNGAKSNKTESAWDSSVPDVGQQCATTIQITDTDTYKRGRTALPMKSKSNGTPLVRDNPPTLVQVESYAVEYINSNTNKIRPNLISELAPAKFHNYYTGRDWRKAKGEPLYDWKNAFRAWLMRDQEQKLERLQKA